MTAPTFTSDELETLHRVLGRCVDLTGATFNMAHARSALEKLDLWLDEQDAGAERGPCDHERVADGIRCRDCGSVAALTSRAVNEYVRVRSNSELSVVQAAQQLRELAFTAKFKGRHKNGKALWRSGRPLQLRWVTEGLRVVWVGQGRPPEKLWPEEGAP